jgi:hypothetical protein
LLADENFNGRILRALQRQIPDLDVVRVQDTPLYGTDDQTLLQFAADENRAVLSRPRENRPGEDGARIAVGQTETGRHLRVVYVPDLIPQSVFVITAYDLVERFRNNVAMSFAPVYSPPVPPYAGGRREANAISKRASQTGAVC